MRYLSLAEVIELHRLVVEQAGGAAALRDLGAPEAAVAQPRATFGGTDLYPTLAAKAAALGYSLALNHASVDGNKRAAHAAMETFLVLNAHDSGGGHGRGGARRCWRSRPAKCRASS